MTPATLCAAITIAAQTFMPMSSDRIKLACESAPSIIQEAAKNDLDPITMVSLIWVESRWVPTAVSRSGACGLTQVLPKYVDETCDQLKIPTTSIRVGAASLKKWTTIRVRRDGKLVRIPRPGGLRASLACYNAGYACLKSTKGRSYADSILAKSAKIAEIIQQNQRKDGRHVSPEPMIFYQGANTVLAYTPWYDGGPAEQYVPIYVPGYSP